MQIYVFLGIFAKFQGQNQFSCSHALKSFMSQSRSTKHFDSVLRKNPQGMANLHFVISAF